MNIRCSAIMLENGVMLCGRGHGDCIAKIKQIYGTPQKIVEQGFLTSANTFVKRKEAGRIAFYACQIDEFVNKDTLYSEDIKELYED